MGLDKQELRAKIKEAFKKAQETPAPDDPDQSDEVQDQILTELAMDLANAIDTFVKSGEVSGITTEVRDAGDTIIGSGVQTGTGGIE